MLSEKLGGSGVLKVIWDGGGLKICHTLKGFLMSLLEDTFNFKDFEVDLDVKALDAVDA